MCVRVVLYCHKNDVMMQILMNVMLSPYFIDTKYNSLCYYVVKYQMDILCNSHYYIYLF